METIHAVHGVYRDILKEPERGLIYDSGWHRNTIVNRCRMLLAGFMKRDSSTSGIQYLQVGQGVETWDVEGIPDPEPDTTFKLENPVADHVNDLVFTYLDAENDPIHDSADEPTERLQITATLQAGYPAALPGGTTYPLREFALFGQFGLESYMINCIRHPVIHKGPTATLIRVVRLYF
jgi:hypothetical protein